MRHTNGGVGSFVFVLYCHFFCISAWNLNNLHNNNNDNNNSQYYSSDNNSSNNHVTITSNLTCANVRDQAPEERCTFAREYCEEDGFIPYVQLYYCEFEEQTAGWVIVFGLWVALLIMMLSSTASTFFCSSIDSLTDILKIPPHIAGSTLLAFGNGAPDLFTAIASFSAVEEDNSVLGVSALLGAGMFVSTVVAGAVVFASPSSVSQVPRHLMKDMLWYCVAILALFLIFLDDKAALWEAIAILGIYLVYVAQVVLTHMIQKPAEPTLLDKNSVSFSSTSSYSTSSTSSFPSASLLSPRVDALVREGSMHALGWGTSVMSPREQLALAPQSCVSLWKTQFEESGYGGKVGMIVSLPLFVCQRVTIPLVAEREWSKPTCLAACVFAPLAIVFSKDLWSQKVGLLRIWHVTLIFSLLLFITILLTTENNRPPKYPLPIALAGFFMAIVWVFTIAEELVTAAGAIGEVLGVSNVIMGITVLAWGNSMSDLVADVALSRSGQASMALTGCFAGCTFNLLVGMGVSLLITTVRSYPEPYTLSVNIDFPIAMGFLTLSVLFSLVYLWLTSFRLTIMYSMLLFIIFITFMTISLLLQLGVILDPTASWT